MTPKQRWLSSLSLALNQMDIPGFLLSVGPGDEILFEMLNRAHERVTGMRSADFAGKSPHEVLPHRMADTVLANYSRCLVLSAPHEYEEVLSIGGMETWWQTVLSPVRGDGDIFAIVGLATNITARKEAEHNLRSHLQELSDLSKDLEVISSNAADQLRAPLRQIKRLNESLVDGFEDLGDGKLEVLEVSGELAESALALLDDMWGTLQRAEKKRSHVVDVNLAHIVDDYAALLDPHSKLQIERPQARLLCERSILEVVLRQLFELAVEHAKSRIEFFIEASNVGFNIFVADDGPSLDPATSTAGKSLSRHVSTGKDSGSNKLGYAIRMIEHRGGKVWLDVPRFDTGATIAFSMSGLILMNLPSSSEDARSAESPAEKIASSRKLF